MSARKLGATLLALALWTSIGQAQEPFHARHSVFDIPFQVDPAELPNIREVQLYVTEDDGRNWRYHSKTSPEQRVFPFRAEHDGSYGFFVRTRTGDGKLHPASLDGVRPSLRVVVDTRLPTATLRALLPRQDQIGVEWEVRDEHLDLQSLTLEYRSQDAGDWQRVAVEPQSRGSKYWTPAGRGPWEVALKVRDKAENQGSARIVVNGGGNLAGMGNDGGRLPPPPMPAPANLKFVNSTEIQVNYTLEDVGPSGVSSVELWYTQDGRNWRRYGEDPKKTSPFIMKVAGEGLYGLTLVVKSGVGLGDEPPRQGDPPDFWVEVDLTRPLAQLTAVDVGRGSETGTMTISWQASDKNLAAQPISLYFAEEPAGEWRPIAVGLENSGRYTWRIPQGVPHKMYVRLEAADKGGNIGRSETAKPVLVDLSRPKGKVVGVEPGRGP